MKSVATNLRMVLRLIEAGKPYPNKRIVCLMKTALHDAMRKGDLVCIEKV